MSDPDHTKTYVRETHLRENREPSGVGMAVIVGGLVVAVGFVLWFLFGALVPSSPAPTGGDTNVTIEPPAAPDPTTDPTTPVEPAPVEPAPAEPAPVEPAPDAAPVEPAPIDPTAPAPAD
jgi:hypothetical protein